MARSAARRTTSAAPGMDGRGLVAATAATAPTAATAAAPPAPAGPATAATALSSVPGLPSATGVASVSRQGAARPTARPIRPAAAGWAQPAMAPGPRPATAAGPGPAAVDRRSARRLGRIAARPGIAADRAAARLGRSRRRRSRRRLLPEPRLQPWLDRPGGASRPGAGRRDRVRRVGGVDVRAPPGAARSRPDRRRHRRRVAGLVRRNAVVRDPAARGGPGRLVRRRGHRRGDRRACELGSGGDLRSRGRRRRTAGPGCAGEPDHGGLPRSHAGRNHGHRPGEVVALAAAAGVHDHRSPGRRVAHCRARCGHGNRRPGCLLASPRRGGRRGRTPRSPGRGRGPGRSPVVGQFDGRGRRRLVRALERPCRLAGRLRRGGGARSSRLRRLLRVAAWRQIPVRDARQRHRHRPGRAGHRAPVRRPAGRDRMGRGGHGAGRDLRVPPARARRLRRARPGRPGRRAPGPVRIPRPGVVVPWHHGSGAVPVRRSGRSDADRPCDGGSPGRLAVAQSPHLRSRFDGVARRRRLHPPVRVVG